MRRLDTLAFLRWTMPRLVKIFDDFPERLLIVGASDDMWRGGLSGPSSLYLHTARPLISENATSTVLHELVHVATSSARERDDWLVEGMAEYYSLEILRRSGGISKKRYDQTMQTLAAWVKREDGKLRSPSSGADTARAVLLLWNLAEQLKQSEVGNLDDLVTEMADSGVITGQHLLTLTEAAIGGKSNLLRKAMAE
jgi:predicted metalloprotease with PDZ domain